MRRQQLTEAQITALLDPPALSSGCEAHPANRSSRKQPEQA
jgi:hypothetical protein